MEKRVKFKRSTLGILLILILSIVLNFVNLSIEGYANTFYAAGVKSMMMNLKNFFFASFDPSGFVTIDKPPFGFWLQTISAKIFGFSGWSIILPQAVAGVLSVLLIYYIIKKYFGTLAGLISALCLALTPITVAAGRNNTIDNLLLITSLLACLAILKASENGKFKFLVLSMISIGIGFNIKMVEAYMVTPAVYITYFLSSTITFKKKIRHLFLGTIILLVISLSWAIIVDLVPTNNRPFIGSSTNNTVMELIVGHNGLQRVGLDTRINGNSNKSQRSIRNISDNGNGFNRMTPENDQSNNRSNGYMQSQYGGMRNSSNPGIVRLFSNNNMSDQIGWLLAFAIIGALAIILNRAFRFPFDSEQKLSLILWVVWLLTEFVYFSFVKNITHTYYLTTMAPSIAALVGIGLSSMWKFYKKHKWNSWFLPIAFIINAIAEIRILSYNYSRSDGYKIIILITAVLSIISFIILVITNILAYKNRIAYKKSLLISKLAVSIAFIAILIAPTVWSFTPIFYKMNGSSPSAGLELAYNSQGRNSGATNDSKLINFLETNKTNEKYLVAVPSAMSYGSDLILETGEPIMTIGGFSGSDKIISIDKFKQLVDTGTIRYAMVNSGSGIGMGSYGFMGSNSNNDLMNWIAQNGKIVPKGEWENSNNSQYGNSNNFFGRSNSVELYDLKYYKK
ncbi:glycosyltransferase family 39 protein [Clostridium pasteurianum]|uniref:PMT family glycosyltransferase, 4-amino-4-deoxy-L-arabinose transferase n=1 Tax=Clostridium pasteurianum BC1 TaxID=86416 RepID=R4KEF2_CLOPA|nr:glycosyltransferase family 39 protein [Clostridium pasteurianum]AGK98949.1 PMT family glycosyltransferase, 4-amino-4-deoxy-L-arabinose transferase [Clostridium pasteurianum BC1]